MYFEIYSYEEKIQLDIDIIDKFFCKTDKEHYQQTIKNLLYLSLKIRSNISFAIMIFNQFTVNSHEKHKTALNQIFSYFKNILDVDIIYYAVKSSISTGFTDASFAHFIVKKNWCSTLEYIFFMTDWSVSWSCKYQFIIAISFMKIKYIDQYNAAWKATWIQSFLKELNYWNLIKNSIIIKSDSQSAEILALNSAFHIWIKHLNVVYHWQQQQIEWKIFKFKDIAFKNNEADRLFKLLDSQLYRMFKDLIHMNEI